MKKERDSWGPTSEKLPCGKTAPSAAQGPLDPQGKASWRERLELYIADQGLKRSEQRWKVMESILSQTEHFTAQELIAKLQKSDPEIGPATVYRCLRLLVDAKILDETLQSEDGETVYELGGPSHHDHIVCLDCHHIFEFHDDALETAQEQILSCMEFEEDHHRHILYARCLRLKRMIK